MKDRVKQLLDESVSVKSFTNTEMERDIETFLIEKIGEISYFKTRPEYFGSYGIEGDYHGRSVVWALVDHGFKDTVVFFHHHDTVDVEDYGRFSEIAFDNEKLKEAYRHLPFSENVKKDIDSPHWHFGRGTADMKAALALQLTVIEEYSRSKSPKVNVLYLSVCDEESYSKGMRAAIGLLDELKKTYNLNYILAIDSEPFESEREDEKVLHVGSVGKLMPVIVTQGILSHIKEPLHGMNAISLLVKVADKIDLHPELAEEAGDQKSPLPSWSYLRDMKEQYDVSTALRASGYFSILYLQRSPKDLLEIVKNLCEEAMEEYYDNYSKLQKQYAVTKVNPKPKVMFFEELLELCKMKEGFGPYYETLCLKAKEASVEGEGYQDITISLICDLLDFYDTKDPLVLIAIAPPYYPALRSRDIEGKGVIIQKIERHYRDYLSRVHGANLKAEEYFMGICDISYCGLDKPAEEYKAVLESMAIDKELYNIDFDTLGQLNIPGINLGPWGKDLHKLTERVYEKDAFELVPEYLLYLLEHMNELK